MKWGRPLKVIRASRLSWRQTVTRAGVKWVKAQQTAMALPPAWPWQGRAAGWGSESQGRTQDSPDQGWGEGMAASSPLRLSSAQRRSRADFQALQMQCDGLTLLVKHGGSRKSWEHQTSFCEV